ncbi:hypothetical protein ACIBF1_30175 [Spirillospora sp. NPDC050679]
MDLSARLGPGWTLGQRDGDADTQTWLVACDGQVHGMVRRYRRKNDSWSKGWEAFTSNGAGWTRLDATAAAGLVERSSFLWSSRDLAAWGIATRPRPGTPRPSWATRRA